MSRKATAQLEIATYGHCLTLLVVKDNGIDANGHTQYAAMDADQLGILEAYNERYQSSPSPATEKMPVWVITDNGVEYRLVLVKRLASQLLVATNEPSTNEPQLEQELREFQEQWEADGRPELSEQREAEIWEELYREQGQQRPGVEELNKVHQQSDTVAKLNSPSNEPTAPKKTKKSPNSKVKVTKTGSAILSIQRQGRAGYKPARGIEVLSVDNGEYTLRATKTAIKELAKLNGNGLVRVILRPTRVDYLCIAFN
jgi:hypothetical protein